MSSAEAVKLVRLGKKANDHIIARLSGGFSLARQVSEIAPEFRTVHALVPIHASVDDDRLFHVGLSEHTMAETALRGFSMWLAEEFRRGRCRGALFENTYARPTDPALDKLPPILAYGEEIYHPVSLNADVAVIEQVIRMGTSFEPFGVASRQAVPEPGSAQHSRPISDAELSIVVASTEVIILGAYDGEGYLLAKRDG